MVGLTLLGMLAAGCRLPGLEGPVSKALATSRQFSRRGVIAIESGQWTEAEILLAKAVKSCPNDPEARRHYAEALWHRGQRVEAAAQLEQAIALVGNDASLHVRLAEMCLAMDQVERAGREAETALDLDPKSACAWATRARAAQAAGQTPAALSDYQRALGYAPNDRSLLLEVAELYRGLDQPRQSLSILHSLIDTCSPGEEPQQVLYSEGLAYAALGRSNDAAESFAAALERGEPTPELLYQLAEAQSQSGNCTEAARSAGQALALDPGHQPSRQLLERLEVAGRSDGPALRR
jgi:tetratricopeptide (TPR) repeat protein